MDFITAKGLIVKETDFNEADKMLTIMTDSYGLLHAKASGIKSLKRKELSGAKPFLYSEFTFSQKGDSLNLREANMVHSFLDIKNDLIALSLGFYILDILGNIAMDNQPNETLLRLTLNTLFALNQGKKDAALIKAAYELKVADIEGFTPHTFECMECGDELDEASFCYFDVLNGGILCKDCCQDVQRNILKISMPTLCAINYILDADIKSFLSFDLSAEAREEFSQVCEKYFLTQSDFHPKTLTYYKKVMLSD